MVGGVAIGASIAAVTFFFQLRPFPLRWTEDARLMGCQRIAGILALRARRQNIAASRSLGRDDSANHFFGSRPHVLHNPYSGEQPRRWRDWQYLQATTAIYGRPVTPSEYAQTVDKSLAPAINRPRMLILRFSFLLLFALLVNYAE